MSLLVEDRELLLAFRAGEPSALRRVLAHYAPLVSRALRGGFSFMAGSQRVRFQGYDSPFDLEDALQEVFKRAFSEHARLTYDGLRPYRAYLGMMMRNTVINDFQARARKLERYVIDEIEAVVDDEGWSAADDPLGLAPDGPSGQPERDAESAELRRLVVDFKEGLAEREAEVFALRFEQGLSHTQLGAVSGWSPSQIKTAEARIRKAFFKFLRRHGYFEARGSSAALIATRKLTQGDAS